MTKFSQRKSNVALLRARTESPNNIFFSLRGSYNNDLDQQGTPYSMKSVFSMHRYILQYLMNLLTVLMVTLPEPNMKVFIRQNWI